MKKIALEVPSWVAEKEMHKKFLHFLMNEARMKTEYYRSLMKPFESKYSVSFPDFKKQVESDKESFEAWDDLIEWEAYYRVHMKWEKNIKS
jgi:hypothetical protein